MIKTKMIVIPIPKLRNDFTSMGFSDNEIVSILLSMFTIWRVNELVEDITREIVFTELDLDELHATMFWNVVETELVCLANKVRHLSLCNQLHRWVIKSRFILMEIYENDDPTSRIKNNYP